MYRKIQALPAPLVFQTDKQMVGSVVIGHVQVGLSSNIELKSAVVPGLMPKLTGDHWYRATFSPVDQLNLGTPDVAEI